MTEQMQIVTPFHPAYLLLIHTHNSMGQGKKQYVIPYPLIFDIASVAVSWVSPDMYIQICSNLAACV